MADSIDPEKLPEPPDPATFAGRQRLSIAQKLIAYGKVLQDMHAMALDDLLVVTADEETFTAEERRWIESLIEGFRRAAFVAQGAGVRMTGTEYRPPASLEEPPAERPAGGT